MQYKIEKNIAPPTTPLKNSYPFESMEIGDSFLIKTCLERDKVRAGAHAYRIRHNPKFVVTIRKVEKGWRIWRVEQVQRQAVSTVSKLKTA